MKNIFLTFLIIATPLLGRADEGSTALISKARAALGTVYRVNFATEGVAGILTVSGNRFALISAESEVYYDGMTLWNFNKKNREVNVESLSSTDNNVLMNPTKLMAVNAADFSHKLLRANVVELTPRDTQTLYRSLVITFDARTSLPTSIVITDREGGQSTTFRVSGFTSAVAVTVDTFRFDPRKHKGVDVVDFR